MPEFLPSLALSGFSREQSETLRAEFQRLLEEVRGVPVRDTEFAIRTDEIVEARANQFLRLRPAPEGQALVLPPPARTQQGDTVTISLEDPEGELVVTAAPSQDFDGGEVQRGTVNGQELLTYTAAGKVTFTSNGADAWLTESQFAAESEATIASTLSGNALDATYLTELPHPSLPNARMGVSNSYFADSYFGLTLDPDYSLPSVFAIRPGAQADGSLWAQLFSEGLNDVPRAWDLAGSLGEGLALVAAVTNANAQPIETVSEYDYAQPVINSVHAIPMPSGRQPGDRIIINLASVPLFSASALDLPADWSFPDGTPRGLNGQQCFDAIELIIAADGSNDPGDTLTITLTTGGTHNTAVLAHVWCLRGTHPTRPSNFRITVSTGSGPTRDGDILFSPWGDASNFWGTWVSYNNNLVTISDFPDDFTTGQGQIQMNSAAVGHDMGAGYGSRLLRADRLDPTSYTFSGGSPTSGTFTWCVAPREVFQIRLSASSSIPAATVLANLFNYATEARAWSLSDLAGIGLSTSTSTGNGPFPEIVDGNSLNFVFATTAEPHLCPMVPISQGQGVLLAVACGLNSTTATPTERPWQLLGTGASTSNRLTLFWLAPADVTEIVAAQGDLVTLDMSAGHSAIAQFIVVDDHHPTQLPTLSAFLLQNSTGATTIDVGSVSPVPGDGSTAGNYTYAAIYAFAVDESVVAGPPANYTNLQQFFAVSSTATIDNSLAWCRRQVRGASEDVGSITYTGSGNGRSVGVNVAFIPASVAVLDWDGLGVRVDGSLIGTRRNINIIDSTSILVSGVDDAANDEVELTLVRAAITGAVTIAQNSNFSLFGNALAKSVLANETNGVAIPVYFAATAAFQHFRVNSANNALEWSILTAGDFPTGPGIVPIAGLANIAAGTQLGRPIDGGTGAVVPLVGEEQGENIRYGNTQEFLSVAAGDYTSASFGTTLAAIDPTVSTLHFSAAGAGDINFHGFPEKNGKRYVIKKRSALGRLVFKHDSGTEGTAGARIEGPGNFDFHVNSVNGSVIIEDQFGRWRPCNLDRPAPSTTQNVGTGGSVALNDDTTQVLVTASITITSFTGADLENRRIILRVVPGEVCTLDHLAVDIRCPRGEDLLIEDNEAVWLYRDVGEWQAVDRLPAGTLLAHTIYTGGSGTHTYNSATRYVVKELWAGGGGGGGVEGSLGSNRVAGGGQAGGYERFVDASGAQTTGAYAVGAGGAGGVGTTGSTADGANGGDTTLASAGDLFSTAVGGEGALTSTVAGATGAVPGFRPGADTALAGMDGGFGFTLGTGAPCHGGAGGSSSIGRGGRVELSAGTGTGVFAGEGGQDAGGGAGAVVINSAGDGDGGDGGAGRIEVWEYS